MPLGSSITSQNTSISGSSISNSTLTTIGHGLLSTPVFQSFTFQESKALIGEDVKTSVLPDIVISGSENGKPVKMFLEPDHSLTAFELLKINRLITVLSSVNSFDSVKFVRDNNLEKHFKFK